MKEPEGYTTAKVDQIIQENEKKSANEQQSTAKQYPNIITVVNETFADIKVLGDFKTNEDYMPYFHSFEEELCDRIYVCIDCRWSDSEYRI